ncbi:MAG TPA: pitrilysin family protein [Bacilli bacterium]|nr:pitrilysin family protein [Bacilli bacterium]
MDLIRKTVLPNGLTVVTEQTPYFRGAVAHLRFEAGSGIEIPDLYGAAHVLEHMVFKGTPTINQTDFGNRIARLGCSTNASTGFEATTYEIDGPAETILQGLDLFAEVIAQFHVPDDELAKEKDVIQEEYKMILDDPSSWGEDLAYHLLLGEFAHPTIGTPENIASFTREQLTGFREAHYTPDNMVVGLVGNVEHEQVVEVVAKHFGLQTRKAAAQPDLPFTRAPHEHREEDCEQEQLFLGFQAPSIVRPDMHVFDAAMTVLGGDSWSRLFHRLRNELGLVYHVEGAYSGWPQIGSYMIYAGCKPEETEQVLAEIHSELDKFKAEITEDELFRAKMMLRSSLMISSDQLSNKVHRLIDSEVLFGTYRSYEDDIADLDSVTLDEAIAMAREVLDVNQATRLTVGPYQPKDL